MARRAAVQRAEPGGGSCSDLRFGVKFQTVNTSFSKVFQMSDRIFMGLAGLATDVQTL